MNGMGYNDGYYNNYDYNNAQHRFDMLERQNYNRGMNGMQNMGNMGNGQGQIQMQVFKGRPVSNFYEANASLIDLDGSLHIFPDFPNNRIYTKKITLDGTAELKTYVLTDNPVEELQNNSKVNNNQQSNVDYIGRTEFESHMRAIGDRIDFFASRIEGILGGIINGNQYGSSNAAVQSNVPNVSVVRESNTNDATAVREQPVVPKSTANGERKE